MVTPVRSESHSLFLVHLEYNYTCWGKQINALSLHSLIMSKLEKSQKLWENSIFAQLSVADIS